MDPTQARCGVEDVCPDCIFLLWGLRVGLVPRMNLSRLMGRMFLTQSLASSLPLEVVAQLLCAEEFGVARACAGCRETEVPCLWSPLKIRGLRDKESDLSSWNEVQS